MLSIKSTRMHAYSDCSDTELMIELGDGNEDGLEEIVRRYQRPLIGYLSKLVHDRERARDLSQETFLRIFRHAAGYRTTTRFTTWLYHIARNLARDELRARRRRPVMTSDEVARSESQDSEQANTDLREQVVTVLKRLSARDRRLLVMRDLKGFSYEEISCQTGLALGTVKSGLNRARARFRDHYEVLNAA